VSMPVGVNGLAGLGSRNFMVGGGIFIVMPAFWHTWRRAVFPVRCGR